MIPLAVLLNRVFSGQGDAAQDDDDHDERFKAWNCHDPMNQDSNPEKTKLRNISFQSFFIQKVGKDWGQGCFKLFYFPRLN
jgi:hypothetical protein